VVLGLAAATRLWLLLGAAAVGRDAAKWYLPQALAFSEGRLDEAFVPGIPPLYPVLGGSLARAIGDVETACRLVSLLAGLAAVVLVFRLTLRLFDRFSALLAAALMALHPYQCRFGASVGPDTLGVALLLAAALGLVHYLSQPRFGRAALVGVALSLLALARPEGFAYAGVVLLLMALWPVTDRARFQPIRFAHVGLLAAVALLLCLPRLWWVHQQTGEWVLDTRQTSVAAKIWQAIADRSFGIGQIRGWQRGGLAAVGDTLESVAAGFGPIALLLGLYALCRHRKDRWGSQAWVPGLLAAFSVLLIFFGNRVSRRYLLGAGALWHPWAGLGLAMIAGLVDSPASGSAGAGAGRPGSHRLRFLIAASLALSQLPWAVRVETAHRAEREMGQWILRNIGPRLRIVSWDAIPAWYAKADHVPLPRGGRTRGCVRRLVDYAAKNGATLIIVDDRFKRYCPRLFAAMREGRWTYGRVLHQVGRKGRTLTLLEFLPSGGTTRPGHVKGTGSR